MAVFLGILLAILLLLLLPIRLCAVTAPTTDAPLTWVVTLRYLFLSWQLHPDNKPKKEKPQKAPEAKTAAKQEKPPPRELFAQLEPLLAYYVRLWTPIKRLLRRSSVAKIKAQIVVVGEDAADTALRFGKANAAIYSAMAVVDKLVPVKVQQLLIVPGFTQEQESISASGELRVLPLAALLAALQVGFWALVALTKSKSAKGDHLHPKTQPSSTKQDQAAA